MPTSAGIAPDAVAVDPGLGFGKTPAQSLALLDGLEALLCAGAAAAVGPSRKRFLGDVTGLPVEERDRATATACALAWERGARLFRVHDVAAHARGARPGPRPRRPDERMTDATPSPPNARPIAPRWSSPLRRARRLRRHPGADGDLLGCRRVHRRREDPRASRIRPARRSS